LSKQTEADIATTTSVLKIKTAGYYKKESELQNADVGHKDLIRFDLL
jgi:hypothetical protein